jgi:hypothetical protein
VEDDDRVNSGLCRLELRETGAPRRGAGVRVRRRPQAASDRLSERADLDSETGVAAWVVKASPTPRGDVTHSTQALTKIKISINLEP